MEVNSVTVCFHFLPNNILAFNFEYFVAIYTADLAQLIHHVNRDFLKERSQGKPLYARYDKTGLIAHFKV